MSEIDLTNLKLQIETLMHSRSKLVNENRILRNRLAKVIQERASLLHRKEIISKKLKTIITQLKEEAA